MARKNPAPGSAKLPAKKAKKTARKRAKTAPAAVVDGDKVLVPADSPLAEAIGKALPAIRQPQHVPKDTLTPEEAEFCALMASERVTAVQAYTDSGLDPGGLTTPQRSILAYMLMERADVQRFIRHCRREHLRASEYSREDLQQFLINAIHTPPEDITQSSEFAQDMTIDREGKVTVTGVKKVECARLLADIAGFKAAQKHEHVVSGGVTIETLQERAAQLGRAMSSAKLVRASEIVEAEVIEPLPPEPTDEELEAMAREAAEAEPPAVERAEPEVIRQRVRAVTKSPFSNAIT